MNKLKNYLTVLTMIVSTVILSQEKEDSNKIDASKPTNFYSWLY